MRNKSYQPGYFEVLLRKMFGGYGYYPQITTATLISMGANADMTSPALVAINPNIHQILTSELQNGDVAISIWDNASGYPRGKRGTIKNPLDGETYTTVSLFVTE